MLSKWTQHLKTPEEKAEFNKDIRGSRFILDRLKQILKEMEQDLDRAEINPKTYDLPNWDYRQAHNNGGRQYLNIFKRLVDLDQEDPNERDPVRPTVRPDTIRP
jgi:hypothetical protein